MEASLSNEPHCLAASILVAAIMPEGIDSGKARACVFFR
jgi:hypothetical protein